MNQRDRNGNGSKRSIYSIDSVRAGDRFLATVNVVVRATGSRPWAGEADLREWRTEQELQDRLPIGDAASAFVDGLRVCRQGSDPDAYGFLADTAPEFLQEFIQSDGLVVERYYKETLTRAGEVRSNRQTIPLVGALTNRGNVTRLISALSYARRKTARPANIIWVKPQVPYWGATHILPDSLRELKKLLVTAEITKEAEAICFVTGRSEYYLDRAFEHVLVSNAPQFPSALEILLIPGVMTAILVYAPIGASPGVAVPLGVMSFDSRVVGRVQDELSTRIGGYNVSNDHFESLKRDLALQDEALDDEATPPAGQ